MRFNKRYQKKKNAGCATWILDGVREVFRKATEMPVTGKTAPTLYNGIDSEVTAFKKDLSYV